MLHLLTDFSGDNVIAFANAAVENVASAIRPCLIIIHNKCKCWPSSHSSNRTGNLHEPMDVDVMTKKFLVLHEGGEEVIELWLQI